MKGLELSAQESTLNDYTGTWTDDGSWSDGTSPGTVVNGPDIDIYGYITLNGNFTYNNGLIEIFDTLIVNGDFTLQNNGDLTIGDDGILIIFGNYQSFNQVQISSGGYFIVTGEFSMVGSNSQGSFDNDGAVFIFDDTPQIKTGSGYGDLQCPDTSDYPANCGYGNEYDIIDDPIFDFFEEVECSSSDTEDPTITAPADVNVNVDPGTCESTGVALGSPVTADNCSVASVTNDAVEPFALGTTLVTWTVTDGSGRTATATQNVIVADNVDPTITAPADVNVNVAPFSCEASGVALGSPVTADNCSVASVTNDAVEPFALGTTLVTWTVTDGSGRTATATQNVIVADNVDPAISAPGDVNVNVDPGTCEATGVAIGTAATADNCSVASVTNDAVEPFALGTTLVTWTVTDGSGNTATATQDVVVTDNIDPTITAPADVNVNVNPGTCEATGVALGSPVTADNCSVASVTNDAVEPFALGTTLVTWTVTDGSGRTATASHNVIVTDNIDPTITAPADVNVNVAPFSCEASGVALGSPVTADNCSVASVTNDAVEPFALGTTLVTWTVTDGSGRTATATQNVIVADNVDPAISAPGDVNVNVDPGTCEATGVAIGTAATADNCSVASVTNDAVEPFALGTTLVTWTVTDGSGNTATATQDVVVTDNIDPTITAPADVNVNVDPGTCEATGVALGSPVTADNCSVASVTNDAVEPFALGTTLVTWTVTDGSGRTATASHNVIVTDNIDPTITAPADVNVNVDPGTCEATGVALGSPVTADNCSLASVTNDAVEPFALGTTLVTWTVTDGSGRTATASHNVIVTDNIDPTITAPADVNVNVDPGTCEATGVALGSPVTADNCSVASVTNDAVEPFALGTTLVTWTVTDGSGRTATASHNVIVTDNIDPTITAPADVNVNVDPGTCEATGVALGSPVTADNCSVASVTNDAVEPFALGTTLVTWTVTDGSGRTATASHNVIVTDNIDPTITAPADVNVNVDPGTCEATGVTLGSPVTADNCSVASVTNDAVEPFALGTTLVTWTVTDGSGRTATASHNVIVTDNIDPTITAPADVNVNVDPGTCEATGVALGSPVTADNCSVASVTNDAVEPFALGTTLVTWTVTDGSGRTATASHNVIVTDNIDPTITAPADVNVNVDPGTCEATGVALGSPVTADNCSVASVTNDAVEPFALGTTLVTWTVTDGSGRTATASHNVIVTDNIDPTITAPADVNVNVDPGTCEATGVALGSPVTADNCSVASVTNDAVEPFALGTTLVTWTVTDGSGRTATASHNVIVTDNIDPTITAPADVNVNVDPGTCEATGVALGSPVTADNCSLASVTNDAVEPFALGTTLVTWTVTDGSGRTATASHNVIVTDNIDPTITAPADVNVNVDPGTCEATGVALGAPDTGDNCSVASVTNDAVEPFALGTTLVTWTVTDGSGRTATASHNVIVTDNIDPTITAPADVNVNVDPGTCEATGVALGSPVTADNCSVASVTNDAVEPFALGTTLVTWTVTDGSGRTATASQNVIVTDNIDPTITAPADVNVNVNPGTCEATGVALGSPVTADNCSLASVTNDAVEPFALGTTLVTWTVTDGSGRTATASHNVIVTDNIDPTITAPADVNVNVDPGTCEATGVALGSPVTADNCSVASVTNDAVEPFALGTTLVTWTVTDGSGRTATASHNVIVTDNIDPLISCPGDIIQCADNASDALVSGIEPLSFSDNCTVNPNLTVTYTLTGATTGTGNDDASGTFNVGTTTVEYTVSDESGNSASCSFSVTINALPNTSIISGNSSPSCFATGQNYSVTGASDSKYVWAVPSGTSIVSDTSGTGKNSITVDFGSNSGPITVTETNTNGCIGTTRTINIILLGCELIADFEADPSEACLNDSVTFTSTSSGVSGSSLYSWNFGEGASPATASGIGPHKVAYSSSGTKSVELSVTEGVSDITTKSFTVHPPPDISLAGNNRCGTGLVIYTASSTLGNSVEFSTDGGSSIASLDNTSPFEFSSTLDEGGMISVVARAINTTTGCIGEWSEELVLYARELPVTGMIIPDSPGIDYFDEVCDSNQAVYSIAAVAGSTHNWSIPALSFSQTGTDQITIDWNIPEGEYSVEVVEISEFGCEGSSREEIVFVSDPGLELGDDKEICVNESYSIEPSELFTAYLWHDGSTQSEYTGTESETIRLTVTNEYGCMASDEINLTVHERPSLSLGNDTSLCGEGGYELTIDGFETYEWSTGDASNSITIYPDDGRIWLRVSDENNCFVTDTLFVSKCDPKKLFEVIPNTFTPNGDGVHDTWVINNIDLYPKAEIKVFDRTGRAVFEVNGGYENDWDGTFDGKALPLDTYYYIIDFKSDEIEAIKGTITIVR